MLQTRMPRNDNVRILLERPAFAPWKYCWPRFYLVGSSWTIFRDCEALLQLLHRPSLIANWWMDLHALWRLKRRTSADSDHESCISDPHWNVQDMTPRTVSYSEHKSNGICKFTAIDVRLNYKETFSKADWRLSGMLVALFHWQWHCIFLFAQIILVLTICSENLLKMAVSIYQRSVLLTTYCLAENLASKLGIALQELKHRCCVHHINANSEATAILRYMFRSAREWGPQDLLQLFILFGCRNFTLTRISLNRKKSNFQTSRRQEMNLLIKTNVPQSHYAVFKHRCAISTHWDITSRRENTQKKTHQVETGSCDCTERGLTLWDSSLVSAFTAFSKQALAT